MAWRDRIGYEMQRVGEHFGIDTLTYNPTIMRSYDNMGRRDAPGFTQRLYEVFGRVRYLDVGAGTGRYAECLRSLGEQADACEHSAAARRMARGRGFEMKPLDLGANPPVAPPMREYDVAFSLEVAEHLTPDLGRRLVSVLCQTPTVVFTAAHPGQGGTGHINEQPRNYWEKLFAGHGYRISESLESRFHSATGDVPGAYLLENLMIFRRESP